MELDISLAPDVLFYLGTFAVTNSFLWAVILSLFLMVCVLLLRFVFLREIPGRTQAAVEILIEGGYDFVRSVIGSDAKARRVFPLVMTMFIFILITNLFTLIPGQSAVTIETVEGPRALFRAVMADYGAVFMLTMVSIIIMQIVSIAVSGPFGYLGRFLNFKSPLGFVLGLMDIVGELAKVLSLSFRLFGNIFAGEVLGAVMLFLLPFLVPAPFLFLGLLSAVVQAFVFPMLTLVFITQVSEGAEAES